MVCYIPGGAGFLPSTACCHEKPWAYMKPNFMEFFLAGVRMTSFYEESDTESANVCWENLSPPHPVVNAILIIIKRFPALGNSRLETTRSSIAWFLVPFFMCLSHSSGWCFSARKSYPPNRIVGSPEGSWWLQGMKGSRAVWMRSIAHCSAHWTGSGGWLVEWPWVDFRPKQKLRWSKRQATKKGGHELSLPVVPITNIPPFQGSWKIIDSTQKGAYREYAMPC